MTSTTFDCVPVYNCGNVPTETLARRASAKSHGTKLRGADPTTTHEKEYTPQELQYMTACRAYSQQHNRPFLTFSEQLHVMRTLGYQQIGIAS